MKFVQVLTVLLVVTSCASTLPPKEERSLTFVEDTKVDKNTAYTNSLSWIAKNFGNSNEVIKSQDKDTGTIILKGNTACNIFRQAGDINDYNLQFFLELNLKDNKARFQFEDLFIAGATGEPVGWEYNQLTDKTKVEKSGECLQNLRNGILNSINTKNW